MNLERLPVHRFLLKVVLWLPLCFLVWYLSARFWLHPVWQALDWGFTRFLPNAIDEISRNGHVMEVITRIKPSQMAVRGQGAVLSFDVNPLVYAYCLPLYAGLTLAAPAHTRLRKSAYLVLGLIALLPVVAWGSGFEILKTLAFTLETDTASYVNFSGGRRELIAWGYQFGFLILPGVMPLALWIALHRDFLRELAPGLLTQVSGTEDS
jgi:hypothetical protein